MDPANFLAGFMLGLALGLIVWGLALVEGGRK